MTLAQARALTPGTRVHYTGRIGQCTRTTGPRGGITTRIVEARVSGQVQTWKRDPSRIRVPVAHGIYDHSAITEWNLHEFHLADECPALPSHDGDAR